MIMQDYKNIDTSEQTFNVYSESFYGICAVSCMVAVYIIACIL